MEIPRTALPRTGTALLVAAAGLAVAVPNVSAARTAPYTAQEICGAGYTFVREAPIVTQHEGAVHRQRGLVVLLHNRAQQRFCGVAIKTSGAIGRATRVRVEMRGPNGRGPTPDAGDFRYYAGPLRMKGRRNAAVTLRGEIETVKRGVPATGGF
jgi:hypothetical protein